MHALTAFAAILTAQGSQDSGFRMLEFQDRAETFNRFLISVKTDTLAPPKRSPKYDWRFQWLTAGYVQLDEKNPEKAIRFRVYAQDRAPSADLAPLALRQLLRMWEFNYDYLRLDHSVRHGQIVDVYLCLEGKEGGEQVIGPDPHVNGQPRTANQIYLFRVGEYVDFIQFARETAHEYGHATLPAVGGFKSPEYWANGELGERLYMVWMDRAFRAEALGRADLVGTPPEQVRQYLAQRVDPLVTRTATRGVQNAILAKMDREGMNEYLGAMLWAERIFPLEIFRRSVALSGQTVREALAAIAQSAEERPFSLRNMAAWRGRAVFLPVGRAQVSGDAKVLSRSGNWVKVQVIGPNIRIAPPKS